MILLAIDTSAGQGSLALARDKECEVVPLSEEWKSSTLHGELSQLLARHGLKSRDVDAYAVANGPGSFTGLRLGLTAAKALAEVHAKHIVTISTLEVIAAFARSQLPTDFSGGIAPLLDARRGQVFARLFRADGRSVGRTLFPVIAEAVCPLRKFLEQVKAAEVGEVCFCGPEIELFAEEIAAAGWDRTALLAVPQSLAGTLASLGMERIRLGQGVSAAAAEANYVRASDAELFQKGP